jgi:hypothetical protein
MAVLLAFTMLIAVLHAEAKVEEIVTLTPPRKIEEEEKKPIVKDFNKKEVDMENVVEDPMITKQRDDQNETPNDEEFNSMKGENMDNFSDKPFKGVASYDTIGAGGGGGGKFGGRHGGKRLKLAGGGGGGRDTEEAVMNALRWLARHQNADGSWGVTSHTTNCGQFHKIAWNGKCDPVKGDDKYGTGVTGLALLAFLGAGYTHQAAYVDEVTGINFADVVKKGLQYLIRIQDTSGRVGEETSKFMYNHLIGAFALCEAYGLTQSMNLREPAQKAVDYTVNAQNPGKAFRYTYRAGDNDSSVSGWAAQVYHSAEISGINFPRQQAMDGLLAWYDEATQKDGYALVGYQSAANAHLPGWRESSGKGGFLLLVLCYVCDVPVRRRQWGQLEALD